MTRLTLATALVAVLGFVSVSSFGQPCTTTPESGPAGAIPTGSPPAASAAPR